MHLLELEVVDIADDRFVFPCDRAVGIDFRACLVELLFYCFHDGIGIFGDDRDLFDRFEAVGKVVYDKTLSGTAGENRIRLMVKWSAMIVEVSCTATGC